MPLPPGNVQIVDRAHRKVTLPPMTPAVTPLYAALLGLIYLVLSLRIPRLRIKHKIGIGDGDNHDLRKAIRVHANFAEYVPLILILLLLVELGGYSPWFVHFMGIVLLAARGLHAYGLGQTSGPSRGRFMGTILTFFVLAACSLLLLLKFALS